MSRKVTHAVLIIILSAIACTGCQESAAKKAVPGGFAAFWNEFRSAVLAGNDQNVLQMTHFPFTTKGVLDDDSVETIQQAEFLKIWSDLLNEDTGSRPEHFSMRRFIVANPISDVPNVESGVARMGNFEFRFVDGKWFLASAFTEIQK